jgi:uncharacterized protein YbjT (DUF2867 family)
MPPRGRCRDQLPWHDHPHGRVAGGHAPRRPRLCAGVCQGARALGARQFILVSSAGAGGPGFYLQTKGAAEDAVRNLGFDRVDLIRPGFLLGQRAERRVWEAIGQRLFAWLSPVLVGSLSRYGAIGADTVADAIVALAGREGAGVYVHHNADLRHIGRHSAPS